MACFALSLSLPLGRTYPARCGPGHSSHNEKPNNIPEYPLTAVREDGEKVRIVTHASNGAEAQWIASELERLHLAGAKWRTFAVLYRGTRNRDKPWKSQSA